MNPLYRKMFRAPGSSREAMGILASSPELMDVVQRRQPVQMANGGSVDLQTIVGQLNAMKDSGDVASLRRIASDPQYPDMVKRIAGNLADSLRPTSVPLIQVGDVNLSNALTDAAQRKPIGQSAGGQERSAKLRNLPSTIASGIGRYLEEGFANQKPVSTMTDTGGVGSLATGTPVMGVRGSGTTVDTSVGKATAGAAPTRQASTLMDSNIDPMTRIGSSMSLEMMNKIRTARGLDPLPATTTDSLVGSARSMAPEGGLFARLGQNQAETERLMRIAGGDTEGGVAPLELVDMPTVSDTGTTTSAEADTGKKDKAPKTTALEAADKLVTDPTDMLPKISEVLKGKESEKKKADAVDKALNIKGTRKERTEQRYAMLKDLLGEDKAKDIRTDANYNLMMAGLMIASGESPDAMTNIAKGLAAGLKGYGEAVGEAAVEAKKEEKALKLMAAKEVGEEITAEAAADVKAKEAQAERDLRREIANLPPADLRTLEAVAKAGNISIFEAYKLAKQKQQTATDTDDLTIAFAREYPQLSSSQARILANTKLSDYGSPAEAIKDLFGIDVGRGTQPAQVVDAAAHKAANDAAKTAGESTYIVGGKSYKVQ